MATADKTSTKRRKNVVQWVNFNSSDVLVCKCIHAVTRCSIFTSCVYASYCEMSEVIHGYISIDNMYISSSSTAVIQRLLLMCLQYKTSCQLFGVKIAYHSTLLSWLLMFKPVFILRIFRGPQSLISPKKETFVSGESQLLVQRESFSFWGLPPRPSEQGLCPWTPLGEDLIPQRWVE